MTSAVPPTPMELQRLCWGHSPRAAGLEHITPAHKLPKHSQGQRPRAGRGREAMRKHCSFLPEVARIWRIRYSDLVLVTCFCAMPGTLSLLYQDAGPKQGALNASLLNQLSRWPMAHALPSGTRRGRRWGRVCLLTDSPHLPLGVGCSELSLVTWRPFGSRCKPQVLS